MSRSGLHTGWMRLRSFAEANASAGASYRDVPEDDEAAQSGDGLSASSPAQVSVSGDSVSGATFSGDSVSGDTVSGDTVSGDREVVDSVAGPAAIALQSPARSAATALNAARRRAAAAHDGAACELCSLRLGDMHRHVLEMASRKIVCACNGCALTFHDVVGGRFKLIPRDARRLTGLSLAEDAWARLGLPIDLAFITYDSAKDRPLAMYPSPAGVTTSQIDLADWAPVADQLGDVRFEPDVEALLVNRRKGGAEYFIAPIDLCYELAGIIRMHWRGFSGGDRVHEEIEAYFDRLHRRVRSR